MSSGDTNPAWIEEFETALGGPDPTSRLRAAVADLLAAGNDRDAIRQCLEGFHLTLHAADREADDDVVLDVLDFLVGWCSPHQRL